MPSIPAPLPGQEHLPWLTPRPGRDTPLPVVRDVEADRHHLVGCTKLRYGADGSNTDRSPVTLGQLDAACGCVRRAYPRELLEAVDATDRRVAVVGLPPGRRWRSTDPLLRAVLQAGVAAGGDDGLVVAALPLPVARWARDVAWLPLVRIRTVDAHAVVPTVAGLWLPEEPDDLHDDLEQAVRTARRLTCTT